MYEMNHEMYITLPYVAGGRLLIQIITATVLQSV